VGRPVWVGANDHCSGEALLCRILNGAHALHPPHRCARRVRELPLCRVAGRVADACVSRRRSLGGASRSVLLLAPPSGAEQATPQHYLLRCVGDGQGPHTCTMARPTVSWGEVIAPVAAYTMVVSGTAAQGRRRAAARCVDEGRGGCSIQPPPAASRCSYGRPAASAPRCSALPSGAAKVAARRRRPPAASSPLRIAVTLPTEVGSL
jgi:hypothetical protein